MRKYITAFLFIFISACTLFASVNRIVAVVNSDVILQSDVDNFLAFVHMQLSQDVQGKELESQMEEQKRNALGRLIEDRLILQEAFKQKIEVDSKRVQERIDTIRKRFSGRQDFIAALNVQGLTMADLEKRFKEQLMMQDIMEKKVRSNITISPQEITAYYMGHLDEFKDPEGAYLDSIIVENQEKLDQALEQLSNGVDFAVVSQRFSKAPGLGQVWRGQLRPDIEDTVFKLKAGEVSKPITTETGICIFRLKEKIPAREKILSEVEDQIRSTLTYKKTDSTFSKWIGKLKKDAYIEIR